MANTKQAEQKDEGHRVCVLFIDSPSHYSGLHRTFYRYPTPGQAELFAGKFAQQSKDEGYASLMRGVFLEEGNHWKTVWSYFHV